LFAVVSQEARSCAVTVNVTVPDCPGLRVIRWNPLSWCGGSPAEAGSPTYSWATSVPALVPVLVTVAFTVAWFPDIAPTCRPLNEKVV
jgi:hypothetical protein